MGVDRWPEDWERRKQGAACPLCASLGTGDDDDTMNVAELPYSEVRIDRRSRLPGYCIVVWRHGHVAEPTELDDEACGGYWRDVVTVARSIEARFEPVKMNFLTLGNSVPHLHTHLVPRYANDPTPGRPLSWDAILAADPSDAGLLARQAGAIRSELGVGEVTALSRTGLRPA